MPAALRFALCGAILVSLVRCPNSQTAAPGGTIVLSIDSTRPVDSITLKAVDKDGNSAEFTFATQGRDLTKEPATGEVVPGPAIKTGPVSFVAFGFTSSSTVALVSGRADAEFLAGRRTTVRLSLAADRVDADQDGFTKQEDCNDNNSKQNGFMNEKCNEQDDNCDGSIDENCSCATGQQRSCYIAADQGTRGLGECRDGAQECRNGVWSTCIGSIGPNVQLCNNGKDEDCDGTIEEGCQCTAGTQRFCFLRSVSPVGGTAAQLPIPPKGECRAGVQRCVGTAWGACEGQTLPAAETCNGKDDDCDGLFDETFDTDGDGYTTCGTGSACGVTTGTGSTGGTLAALVDCDDASAMRHPCQLDRCGDMSLDEDCSGAFNECQGTGTTCASAGYAAGYVDFSGRLSVECRATAGVFGTECDTDSGICKDAAAQCAGVTTASNILIGTARPQCFQALGCVPGTVSTPNFDTPVANGTDPYNDCGPIDCDMSKVFAKFPSGASFFEPGTGWFIAASGPSGRYECRAMEDVPDNNSVCINGACRGLTPAGVVAECRGGSGSTDSLVVNTVVSTDPNAIITQACKLPLAGSCRTTLSGGVSGPLSTNVPALTPDPLIRCSTPPGATLACDGMVTSPFGVGTVCTFVNNPPASINQCNGSGACDPTIDADGCASSGGTTTTINCGTTACRNVAACDAVTSDIVNEADPQVCFNANGGPFGGVCASGQTCYAGSAGGGVATSCGECTLGFACGSNCLACDSGGAQCRQGLTRDATGFSTLGATGTDGDTVTCICPNVTVNTRHMFCGSTCCSQPNQRCSDTTRSATCTAVAGGTIPCGATSCDPATQICDMSTANFTCVTIAPVGSTGLTGSMSTNPGRAPCNQTVCQDNFRCSNNANTQCQDCNALTPGSLACNTACCAPGQVCTNAATSTCANCDLNSRCGANSAVCGGGTHCGVIPGENGDNCTEITCRNCETTTACGNDGTCGGSQACRTLVVDGPTVCAEWGCVNFALCLTTNALDDSCGLNPHDCTADGDVCLASTTANGDQCNYACGSPTEANNKLDACCGKSCENCGSQVCATDTPDSALANALVTSWSCQDQNSANNFLDSCCGQDCEVCAGNETCATQTPGSTDMRDWSCKLDESATYDTTEDNLRDGCCGAACTNCGAGACAAQAVQAPGSLNFTEFDCEATSNAAYRSDDCCGPECFDCAADSSIICVTNSVGGSTDFRDWLCRANNGSQGNKVAGCCGVNCTDCTALAHQSCGGATVNVAACTTCDDDDACGTNLGACTFPSKCFAPSNPNSCGSYTCTGACNTNASCGQTATTNTTCTGTMRCGASGSATDCDNWACRDAFNDSTCGFPSPQDCTGGGTVCQTIVPTANGAGVMGPTAGQYTCLAATGDNAHQTGATPADGCCGPNCLNCLATPSNADCKPGATASNFTDDVCGP